MSLLKKINMMIAAALVLVLTLGILTACAKSSPSGSSSTADSASEEETFQNESSPAETMIPATDAGTKTLVVYFSATGTTKAVAVSADDTNFLSFIMNSSVKGFSLPP